MGTLDSLWHRGSGCPFTSVISPRGAPKRGSYPDDTLYCSLVSRHGNPFVYRACGSCPDRQHFSRPTNCGDALHLWHDPTSAMETWRSVSDGVWPRLASALLRSATGRRSPHPMSFVPSPRAVTGMYVPASDSATCSGSCLTSICQFAEHRAAIHWPHCGGKRRLASLLRSGCAKALQCGLQRKRRRHQLPDLSPHRTVANMRCVFEGNASTARRSKKCASSAAA
jgi:hypothetical protein